MKNETDCDLNSFAGKIICVSDPSGQTGTEVKDVLHLTTEQVKAQAIKTYSESDVKDFVERIPELYEFKSTVFTNLGK